MTYNPPTYCADVAGSLFDKSHWGWDVSRLDSLLSRTLKRKNITLKGVNSAYLYFGMWRSLFAWHTEDLDLYSVNYLHFGAPKFWYAIAPEDRERFEILAQGMVPEMWRACPEFLRHKELLISPTLLEQNGIPFTRMVQHPGEFVVTYPGSYHSGFNTGFNCAESCNFATEAWVEYGECAGSCECVPDSVKLDMSIFEDEENGVCKLVDEDDYTRVKRGRVGEPRRRPTGEEDVKVKREKEDLKKEKAQPNGEKGGTPALPRLKVPTAGDKGVLVPEGWKRTVVKKSPKGARETTYKSPDGKPIRSRSELTRYLGSNPRCGATLRDFYFETKAEDLPPARLLAPGTPSPAASGGDDAKGKVKGSFGASSGRAALKVKNGGVSKPSSGAKRGSGSNASTPLNARDSLGGFLGLDSIRKTLKLEPNSNAGVKKSSSGGAARANASNAGAPKPPPSTKASRTPPSRRAVFTPSSSPSSNRRTPSPPTHDGPLTASAMCHIVAALQPKDCVVVDESLTSGASYWDHSATCERFSHLTLTGGAIGFGPAAAVGAAVACPGRKIINIQADGSGLYSAQALWTQAKERLDVVTVVCANRKYAILKLEHAMQRVGAPGKASKARSSTVLYPNVFHPPPGFNI